MSQEFLGGAHGHTLLGELIYAVSQHWKQKSQHRAARRRWRSVNRWNSASWLQRRSGEKEIRAHSKPGGEFLDVISRQVTGTLENAVGD